VVFDGAVQRFYDKTLYYQAIRAQPWHKYQAAGAVLIAIGVNRGRGPRWRYDFHKCLGLPWGDPKNPNVITTEEATRLLVQHGFLPPPLASY
jgi:hypothetical protein